MADEVPPTKTSLLASVPWKLILIVVNLSATVVGTFLVWSSTLGLPRKVVTESDALHGLNNSEIFNDKPIVYSLDPFTVNLAGEDERIVQIEVTLEMIDEDGFEEVVTMGGNSRDIIVQILNGKTYEDIETIQGKLYLKDEITLALNGQLQRSFIKDIYFSRFVIQ